MIPSVLPTYSRAPLTFVKGEGSWLTEADGRRFLDLGAGIAVNALGHAHPDLVAALTEQAGRLWHTSNLYHIPQQQALADRLVAASFADTVFFTNSGTESCELAVKMARKYWYEKGQPDRVEIITFEGAFHGRSSAAIAASGSEKMTRGFGPLLPGFRHLPWNDPDALRAAIGNTTAAVLIATENAAAGMGPGTHGSTYGGNPLACAVGCAVFDHVADPEFLAGVRRKAEGWRQRLENLLAAHPSVFEELRGIGLMLGLRCRPPNTDVVAAACEAELITVPAADNVVRLLPPLNISEADLVEATHRLDIAATALKTRRQATA